MSRSDRTPGQARDFTARQRRFRRNCHNRFKMAYAFIQIIDCVTYADHVIVYGNGGHRNGISRDIAERIVYVYLKPPCL
jgi:hypothetical protein